MRALSPGLITAPPPPPLPTCGLAGPSRGLWTAPGAVRFACALGVTIRVLDESARALWTAAGSVMTVRSHAVLATGPVTVRGHGTGCFSPLTGPSHGREVGSQVGVAKIVWRLMVPPRIVAKVPGGVCSYGCGQLHPSAQAFVAGPHQAVPQPVGVPCTVGCGSGICVFGCCRFWCWVVAWSRCAGVGSSPLCVFVCECDHSRWRFFGWCCFHNRFCRSEGVLPL